VRHCHWWQLALPVLRAIALLWKLSPSVKQGMMLELVKDFNGALAIYDPALREAELFTQEARTKLAAYLPHIAFTPPEACVADAADQSKAELKTETAAADATPAGESTKTAMQVDPLPRADTVGRRRVPHTSVTTAAGFATVVQQATALAAALAADRDDDDDGDQSRARGESGSAADESAARATKHSRSGHNALTPEEQDVREWRRNLSDQLRQWLETLHRIQFVRASVHLELSLEEQANRGEAPAHAPTNLIGWCASCRVINTGLVAWNDRV